MKNERGSSSTEYGLLLALLGALGVGAVFSLGGETSDAFSSADDALRTSLASSEQLLGSNNSPSNEDTGLTGCFVEEGGDSSNSFVGADGYTCFEVANGYDELTVSQDGRVTVIATGDEKTISLSGSGPHEVALEDVAETIVYMNGGTLTGLNSAAVVVSESEIEVVASGAADQSWNMTLSDEDDSVTLSGAKLSEMNFKNGDAFAKFSSLAPRSEYGAISFGLGTTNLSMSCQDPEVDWSSNTPYSVDAIGTFSGTVSSCPFQGSFNEVLAATSTSAVSRDIDLNFASPSNYTNVKVRGPFSSALIDGKLSGANNSLVIDTMIGKQEGPAVIDVDLTGDYTSPAFNGPRALLQIDLSPDRAYSSPGPDLPSAFPTTVSVDTSAVVASGNDSYVALVVDYPTANQTIALTGGGTGTRHMMLGFGDPSVYGNVGVPTLSSDSPVNVVIKTPGCWAVTLHAKSGSGFPDVSHPAGDCAYYNTTNVPAVSDNISSYEGATLYAPSGSELYFGFNGGSFKNGADLSVGSIIFGHNDRDDNQGSGGPI